MPAAVDEYLNITTRLRALPQLEGDPDGWQAVRRKREFEAERPRRRARVARYASAASLAALGLIAGLKLLEAPPSVRSVPDAATVASALAEDRIESLRVRSQALEELLAAMPSRPAVERAGTSLPIESLEAEVQWLDHQMSLAGAVGEPAPEAERLWADRVEVMNSLVQLRYVEAQRFAL
jgi:hypothetical protein